MKTRRSFLLALFGQIILTPEQRGIKAAVALLTDLDKLDPLKGWGRKLRARMRAHLAVRYFTIKGGGMSVSPDSSVAGFIEDATNAGCEYVTYQDYPLGGHGGSASLCVLSTGEVLQR